MPVVPNDARPEPPFDLALLIEFSELEVRDLIAGLPEERLKGCKTTLISRLVPDLWIRLPEISWDAVSIQTYERLSEDGVQVARLRIPMEDPSWVTPYVSWPESIELVSFDAKTERGEIEVSYSASDEVAARASLDRDIAIFRNNLREVASDIERYNAALPYLFSIWFNARLLGLPLTTTEAPVRVKKASAEECRHALDELVAEGEVVAIHEVDPSTGKVQKRHYHKDHAPKLP